MNKTQKIILSLAVLSLITLPIAVSAYTSPTEPGSTVADVEGLVSSLVGKIWIVFAAIAVVMFVFAGVTFLLAGGAPEKIATARSAAIWGVVGVVVMVLSFSIFTIATSLIT